MINVITRTAMSAFFIHFSYVTDSYSIGFGEYPVSREIKIRDSSPVSESDLYETKFLEFKEAIDDNDFKRIIKLFQSCAEQGDGFCQFFLADGVSEWRIRDVVLHEETYGDEFIRKWLRQAIRSFETYPFVTMNWSTYYSIGLFGFPEDRELYLCWRDVTNSNLDMSRAAVLGRAGQCRATEVRKYGSDADWLKY